MPNRRASKKTAKLNRHMADSNGIGHLEWMGSKAIEAADRFIDDIANWRPTQAWGDEHRRALVEATQRRVTKKVLEKVPLDDFGDEVAARAISAVASKYGF